MIGKEIKAIVFLARWICRVKVHCLGFIVLVLVSECRGEIAWDAKIIEVVPSIGDSKAYGKFSFRNVGKAPIDILGIKKSCDCLVVRYEKTRFMPGQSGEILLSADIGPADGVVTDRIILETNDVKETLVELILRMHLDYIVVNPPCVSWGVGEPPAEKKITLTTKYNCILNITKTMTSNDILHPSLRTIKAGIEYELWIKPRTTDKALNTTVSIVTDNPHDHPRIFHAYANITK